MRSLTQQKRKWDLSDIPVVTEADESFLSNFENKILFKF